MPDNSLTIATNELSQTLDIQQITPEYFIAHYPEFIQRVIAKGNPSSDTMRHYCNQIDFFIRWCLANQRNPLTMNEYQLLMYREFLINRQYTPGNWSLSGTILLLKSRPPLPGAAVIPFCTSILHSR